MRRFLPSVGTEELDDLYTDLAVPAGDERPHVYLGMVASVDGAATVDGRTGGLGGAADRSAFRRLRETCDAVLVGAGTVRAERYGPPRAHPGTVERRRQRGLSDAPSVVVVSASLELDPAAALFADPQRWPVVLTVTDAEPGRRAALAGRAELVDAGRDRVQLGVGLRALRSRGVRRLLCEGGPSLNAELLACDLVDEIFLTVAPTLVGGGAPRIVAPRPPVATRELSLVELREHDGELLLRYRLRDTDVSGRVSEVG